MAEIRQHTATPSRRDVVIYIVAGLTFGWMFVDCAARQRADEARIRELAVVCRQRDAVLVRVFDASAGAAQGELRCARLLDR